MKRRDFLRQVVGGAFVASVASKACCFPFDKSPYSRWPRGLSAASDYFPIGVWLQNPSKAARYKAAGMNLYIALWQGPTEAQLAQLGEAGMRVICDQNEVGLKNVESPVIAGWMHGDEPDNAQSLGAGKGYGPPVLPTKIVADYERIRRADPSRPVMLNLGQGVAWDEWVGRGERTNHPEDYAEYVKGCDIASFDIYPVANPKPSVQGQLWRVAHGVERLRKWAGPSRPVWSCIECTRISSEKKATPHQVKCEVWMALIHGSQGLIYFVHEWKPRFNESALLDDAEMLHGVTAVNRSIQRLAPVLNSPALEGIVLVKSSNPDVPIAISVRRHGEKFYLFAVAMREGETRVEFSLKGKARDVSVDVFDEGRTVKMQSGIFGDVFGVWDVHLYCWDI